MSDVFVYRDMGIEYPDTIYAGSPSTLIQNIRTMKYQLVKMIYMIV